jgi:hypothetical protein
MLSRQGGDALSTQIAARTEAVKATARMTSLASEVRDLPLADIAVLSGRMRSLRQEVVDELALSMMERQRLLQPIVLRPADKVRLLLPRGREAQVRGSQESWLEDH